MCHHCTYTCHKTCSQTDKLGNKLSPHLPNEVLYKTINGHQVVFVSVHVPRNRLDIDILIVAEISGRFHVYQCGHTATRCSSVLSKTSAQNRSLFTQKKFTFLRAHKSTRSSFCKHVHTQAGHKGFLAVPYKQSCSFFCSSYSLRLAASEMQSKQAAEATVQCRYPKLGLNKRVNLCIYV